MKIKIYQLLFISLLNLVAIGQNHELGKVSIVELEKKLHPKEPDAAAAILYKIGEYRVQYSDGEGFVGFLKVKMRIKIYKKEGYNWGNFGVVYRSFFEDKEVVDFSNAVTYNLEAGKIVKSYLKSDGRFDEKITKYNSNYKISMPNVKEGSVIEFEYQIKSPFVDRLRRWYFQAQVPIDYCEYRTYIPEYFVYTLNLNGAPIAKTEIEKREKSIMTNDNVTYSTNFAQVNNSVVYGKLDYSETNTKYTAENVASVKNEMYVNNIDNYISSIDQELSYSNLPKSPIKTYSTDWESVTKTIYKDDDFNKELEKTGYYEDDINILLKGLNTQEEKINAIFQFVKTKVKWNYKSDYICYEGVKNAYKTGVGNAAEINLMLTSMLRFAGIDAFPVLISTRDNGIKFFPNRTGFNFVISGIETESDTILLDATDQYAMPNVLPFRDLNWIGRLIRKEGATSKLVDLLPKKVSKVNSFISATLAADGSFSGKVKHQFYDYEALNYREENLKMTNAAYLEKLEKSNNNTEITEYKRENEKDLSKPVAESFSYKDKNDTEQINGKLYFSPLLFIAPKENIFKQELRNYPVDFGYPTEHKFTVVIDVPDNYKVELLPSSVNYAMHENIGTFKYKIAQDENKIQVMVTTAINEAIISADYYDDLKEFYKKNLDKMNEKIVLVKK